MNKIMENNEQLEETLDTATDAEQIEEQDGQEETKDWKAEALKYRAIAERKEKKLQEKPQSEEIIKPKTEQDVPTLQDMALIQKGLSIDEVNEVKEAAKILGVDPVAAYDNDIVQAKINKARHEAQVKSNTLPASGGAAPTPRGKTVSNMTDEEHEKFALEKLRGAVNR